MEPPRAYAQRVAARLREPDPLVEIDAKMKRRTVERMPGAKTAADEAEAGLEVVGHRIDRAVLRRHGVDLRAHPSRTVVGFGGEVEIRIGAAGELQVELNDFTDREAGAAG